MSQINKIDKAIGFLDEVIELYAENNITGEQIDMLRFIGNTLEEVKLEQSKDLQYNNINK